MTYDISEKNGVFDVLETPTGVTIVLKTSKQIADSVCKKLNRGGGFDGFTPDFFASIKGHDMGETK